MSGTEKAKVSACVSAIDRARVILLVTVMEQANVKLLVKVVKKLLVRVWVTKMERAKILLGCKLWTGKDKIVGDSYGEGKGKSFGVRGEEVNVKGVSDKDGESKNWALVSVMEKAKVSAWVSVIDRASIRLDVTVIG